MIQSGPQVLIVGAGPAGLGAAIELGQRGVRVLLVERNDRVGYAPRAKTTNVRTREHLRRWGIAHKLAAAAPLGVDYPSDIYFVTRMSEFLLTKIPNANYCAPGKNPLYSEHGQWIPQYTVEEVLRQHAQSFPNVDIRFSTELMTFTQDATGVTARIRALESQAESEVRVAYLIGADGSRSTVRELIGAKMDGIRAISKHFNLVYRSRGLAKAHRHGPGIMYWQVNPDSPSVTGPMDRDDRWFFGTMHTPENKITLRDAEALIRKSTGIDTDYEALTSDEWTASRLIADKYRDRRVFLVGDACHLHPPFGGYGMNMGVADGVDVGWKMAAVLHGWGGASLLDSYEIERKPVHNMVMDEAVANHALLSNKLWEDGLQDATAEGEALRRAAGARMHEAKSREFYTLGVILGYRYGSSPCIVPDGSAPPRQTSRDYVPSAHPGCLAPHAWLADGSSLYDHFGTGFTLLADGADDLEIDTALVASTRIGLPLAYIAAPSRDVAALYAARYTLIRPDQHVAWRGDSLAGFEKVLNQVAGHSS